MTDGVAEVAAWFEARGFDLSVTQDSETWWATLTPLGNPGAAMARYGRGDTSEAAAARARERYEQEQ
jgi:hypothetical protein